MQPSGAKVILQFGKEEDAGYIEVEKNFEGKRPYTMFHLTDKGRGAFDEYRKNTRQALDELSVNNF